MEYFDPYENHWMTKSDWFPIELNPFPFYGNEEKLQCEEEKNSSGWILLLENFVELIFVDFIRPWLINTRKYFSKSMHAKTN